MPASALKSFWIVPRIVGHRHHHQQLSHLQSPEIFFLCPKQKWEILTSLMGNLGPAGFSLSLTRSQTLTHSLSLWFSLSLSNFYMSFPTLFVLAFSLTLSLSFSLSPFLYLLTLYLHRLACLSSPLTSLYISLTYPLSLALLSLSLPFSPPTTTTWMHLRNSPPQKRKWFFSSQLCWMLENFKTNLKILIMDSFFLFLCLSSAAKIITVILSWKLDA